MEDRGGYGEDTGGLVAALEQAVRDQGLLRLQADEDAVPPWLREGEGEAREASLRLGGWIDRQGRVHLVLWERSSDAELAAGVASPRVP